MYACIHAHILYTGFETAQLHVANMFPDTIAALRLPPHELDPRLLVLGRAEEALAGAYIYVYIYIYIYIYLYIYICTHCICICVYMYMHICVPIYI